MSREITAPVELCLPDGSLNPDAVGWSRRPLHTANLTGWGRTKRWEYWGIVTPRHVIGVVVSSLDYAGVHSLYVLDRETHRELTPEAVVPLARGAQFPGVSGAGTAYGRGPGLEIAIDQQPDATAIRATAESVALDLRIGPGQESLGVVVPWSTKRFQYTVKDLGRPVEGTITVDGVEHAVTPADSFAVLDHGRGRWPYSMTWNWAAGSRPGGDLGIQLGGKWTGGTGQTENGIFVDGRLHKIHEELTWTYDRTTWMAPWTIEGPRVSVTLTPFHERVARTNLLVVAGETHQCFGTFSGWAVDDDGRKVELDGLVGWAEEAHNRW
ncbi:DUF2804 domain-containing protein [Ornithinimicrobium humiphilum]|uniref:Uncharacterized protein DUF2804 n=1 Tax=Ornithinimicrobium humiphilum TaxID=125288 RepID=A0A543KLC9_9MICO|nr:DUF2804 domain-containing protein [Ornithinimicrobium humiphilum]TQM95899.1 uncharacterized protein DUF2804 [Ornithinimicrobium humiphilum]